MKTYIGYYEGKVMGPDESYTDYANTLYETSGAGPLYNADIEVVFNRDNNNTFNVKVSISDEIVKGLMGDELDDEIVKEWMSALTDDLVNDAVWDVIDNEAPFNPQDIIDIEFVGFEVKDAERIEEAFEKAGGPFWYFTTHGLQPGTVPKDIDILDVKDTPNGTYFASNKVLTTKELQYYEIKEKKPNL